jgi:hypothetical protein
MSNLVRSISTMKVKNVSTKKLYLKDLKISHESQVEGRRGEDSYLAAGASVYLPDTSEVLRSAVKGDIAKFVSTGVLQLNETISLDATGGANDDAVITHNLGYLPTVVVCKQSGQTWVQTTLAEVSVVHNAALKTVTLTNLTAGALTVLVKVS